MFAEYFISCLQSICKQFAEWRHTVCKIVANCLQTICKLYGGYLPTVCRLHAALKKMQNILANGLESHQKPLQTVGNCLHFCILFPYFSGASD